MKISYNWLKEFIAINESPEEVAALLTGSGLEVEGIEEFEQVPGGLKGLVIGEVLSCEKHPAADRLSLTKVNLGEAGIVPIVCGAPNVAAGQKVVVATVGTTLYPSGHEPFKIKKSKIRGEASEGMICAEDEIGLGASHDGILVLDTDLPAGTPAAEFFNLESDIVFEIGLTPNRGDATSHFGVSRDLKALLNRPLTFREFSVELPENKQPFSVEVQNTQACLRYCGVTISGLKVEPSPKWLQTRIASIGLSPINNVVDITNYILHDLGQPLHAFDLDRVKGNKITVRNADEGAKFKTLDGEERTLKNFDLVIANEEEPMCLAGVFGGMDSGVSDTTTSIFLESACFSPDSVRKTSTWHSIKTDSSFRFERGTDPEMPLKALKKAVALITEIAGGELTSEIFDLYLNEVPESLVETSFTRIWDLIGKEIPSQRIIEILENLDIRVLKNEPEKLLVSVPAYRTDVKREADIVEEIIRIYGYDNIEIPDKISTNFLADFPEKDKDKMKAILGQVLSSIGFSEIITNSLTKPEYASSLGIMEGQINILNKLSEDLGVMRQSLLFSGLEVVQYNINRKQKDLKFFEFGKTYHKDDQKYSETEYLSLFVTGNKIGESWAEKSEEVSFYDLKTVVHSILAKLNIQNISSETINNQTFKYGLTYTLNNKVLVSFGLLQNKVLKVAGIKQDVWYAEFNSDILYRKYYAGVEYEEVSKFPEVRRDLSLVIDKSVTFEQISKLAEEKERKLLQSVNAFDVFEGKNIGEGKKSYSICFILQDKEKTLTDKVIDKTMEKFIKAFEEELGAIIRK